MPLLLILLALLLPRITILLLWLLTNWFDGMFSTILLPLVGFLFLPITMLWYSVVHHWFHGEWGVIPIVGLILTLIMDLSPVRRRTRRYAVSM